MNNHPVWLRVWILGTLLGAASGAVAGTGLLAVMFVSGGVDNGFYSDASAGFVVGFILCVVMGAAVGALVGAVLGFLSAGLAAPILQVLSRFASQKVAVGSTVALVLLVQTIVGLAVVEPGYWWTAFIVPTISVIPLLLATTKASGGWAELFDPDGVAAYARFAEDAAGKADESD